MTANGHGASFGSDEDVLELESGGGCKLMWMP